MNDKRSSNASEWLAIFAFVAVVECLSVAREEVAIRYQPNGIIEEIVGLFVLPGDVLGTDEQSESGAAAASVKHHGARIRSALAQACPTLRDEFGAHIRCTH